MTNELPAGAGRPVYRVVLVPLDGSSHAERALPHAEALASALDAEVVLLRATVPLSIVVSEPPEVVPMVHPAGVIDTAPLAEAEREDAVSYLDAIAERFRRVGLKVSQEHHEGQPSEIIIDRARSLPADMIVMATHGRSGLSRFVYGSVTAAVLKNQPCPVMLVPLPRERGRRGHSDLPTT